MELSANILIIVTTKRAIILLSILSVVIAASFLIAFYFLGEKKILSPLSQNNTLKKAKPTVKPLDKYSFEELKKRNFLPSTITLDRIINDNPNFTSRIFFFTTDGKKVSGLINLPKKSGVYPVIIQFRGYINPKNYTIGAGTRHSGEVFAENGFITLAPDFLGYGESASQSADPLEERFETYTTALNLLASLPNLNIALSDNKEVNIRADISKIGIWGHSNGGHIALSIAALTGKNYPIVLWNPVSKPFPYSVLYYTDEMQDNGKSLRKILADFEKDYDIERYSTPNYFKWINAPIELHQAVEDEAVPKKWSDELYKKLKSLGKEITYFTYPGDNHDFNRGSWQTVVGRNIKFYKEHFTKTITE